ncbi:hypothetical protein CC1G_06382 [Coprinopsis cinerea okayama7|uniref:Peptidase M48 domain-containing protein n=1 Tax=Coprinopsis cinerea (strain Okayama-7 / 130 / ATCC MYA-4618 / FGSC 9003) TaxID=240176 RepID=A8NTT3_COPC7|nr:hypothetical protein CC1G_06382 [Coprinopsis cinerea okayama7\|eukprot:XP_001836297.2 hypothetical protein CC1G_06382 [Coprinopsis cinerea okayama7\
MMMKHAHIHGIQISEEKREKYMKRLKLSTRLLQAMLLFPFLVFWATIVASLEQTPLTGRWRTIFLSPEEEDDIAAQLIGPGWYNAVHQVLSEEGEPKFIPPTDWRYQWVRETLQRLVAVLPILEDERHQAPNWVEVGPDDRPLPPPARYPLKPRPRAVDYIRLVCHKLGVTQSPRPSDSDHFALLLVDSPVDSNAFSYGFWPNGGSGIVVYSGFLDDIFAKTPLQYVTPPDDRSWLSQFLGVPPPQPYPVVNEEQTTDLAVLLAHELSHLILCHHLESLSSSSIVVPGTISIIADIVRVLVFPITMFFGPFVNDAVAKMGDVGSGELRRMGEWCTTAKQEVEADVVSARILAYAGFDARDAVKFWENRSDSDPECHRVERDRAAHLKTHRIRGVGHPENARRIEVLKQELSSWEKARLAAAAARA